ncbi:hypothetical protein GCM10027169_37470 [Gordonia jinhuaensis]|uniref:YCII-related domain-containing protein n=1 Tax=Gordonia jinhuaensis TaxID=1517702 RepID=A0A916WQZ3_9ACTN|nr:YciI family protein [Gordonia jinhuaensis]GGB26210.1 hypothetical protein GCM10011489_12960 [Gordonia jinhuaensis]
MPLFAVHHTYSPDHAGIRDEHRPAHREWLKSLYDTGVLKLSGPYADGLGALLMFEADTADELRATLSDDPFARAQAIADVRVDEWVNVYSPFS